MEENYYKGMRNDMKREYLVIVLVFMVFLLNGCLGSKQQEEKWTLIEKNVITLSDGASVDLWTSDIPFYDVYKLADETILLRVEKQVELADSLVIGVESYNDLSELAQGAVDDYYDNLGLLYNLNKELEKAYAEYKKEGARFNSYFISQTTVPIASNDKIMCFLTAVTVPIEGQTVDEFHIGAVFDKSTGEYIDVWDVFITEKKETKKILLEKSGIEDSSLKVELIDAFEWGNVCMFRDHLEIFFPQGILPSQEHSLFVAIDYDDIQDILQNWAKFEANM